MNDNSGNPYFKERDISKPNAKITFKLSDELYTDFNNYLEMAYPETIRDNNSKINYSYAFRLLVPDILNSKCIERKTFKINALAIFPKTISTKEGLPCFYIGSRDNYLIKRLNKEPDNLRENQLNNKAFLPSSEELSVEEILRLHDENYFSDTVFINRLLQQDRKYFKDNVEHFIEETVPEESLVEYTDFSFIKFEINNYLDEFIDKEFKSKLSKVPNADVHTGLTYFKDEETNLIYYFVYDWLFYPNNQFKLLNMLSISERLFNKLIIDSSNTDLHSFLRDLKEGNVEAIEVTEETKIEKLLKENKELQEELKLQKDYIRNLEESYEELKSNKKRLPLAIESEELFNLGYNEAKIDFKRNFDKILHDYNINLDKVIFEEGKVPYLELSDIDEDSSED